MIKQVGDENFNMQCEVRLAEYAQFLLLLVHDDVKAVSELILLCNVLIYLRD